MGSNIFCFLAAIWTLYLLVDGWRRGSILLKGGRRADRDQQPGSFYFWSLFYAGAVVMFIAIPMAGMDLFGPR